MDPQELVNLNTIQATTLIKSLKALGIQHFHSSPGLRNAPLLNAIANISELTLTSHFDERATAYRALAQAKITGQPTAILCTSGTALINFYPAVIEAYFQEIPIIIISSDRPKELIDGLANQCIYQEDIFGKYVSSCLQIDAPTPNSKLNSLVSRIMENTQNSISKQRPMHINIAFLDPANKAENSFQASVVSELTQEFKTLKFENTGIEQPELKTSNNINTDQIPSPDLIAIGELPINWDNDLKEELFSFLSSLEVPITSDVTSQMKYTFQEHTYSIPSVDHPEVKQWLNNQNIKNVWHFGGRITSKHFYQTIKKQKAKVYEFSNSNLHFNPALTDIFRYELTSNLLANLSQRDFEKRSAPQFKDVIESKRSIIDENTLSFPLISKKLLENYLCKDDILVLANSTCIRSFDFFASIENVQNPAIYCHRGASGIEGFFASIKGISESLNKLQTKRIVAVLGDITALHDLNSLFLFNEKSEVTIDIFIVNDQGGGIFRLLSVPEMENCKKHMETPHQVSFSTVLEGIFKENQQVNVKRIDNKEDFLDTINKPSVVSSPKINFYEIVLNQNENNKVYQCLKTISSNHKI